jgi:segregation and condensation protein A
MHAHPVALTAAPAPRPAEPPVRIGVYDGPLELLLFLVRREGVDVRDIPVARICDAYLAFLGDADDLDVDRAGDYLLMAATLCQLKARELIPRAPDAPVDPDEDGLDPKEALARRLAEYERYRAAAEEMGARERLDRDVFARPVAPTTPEEQPIDPVVDAFGLLRTFYAVLERAQAPPPVHAVQLERFSLLETVRGVLRALDDVPEMLLSELMRAGGGSRARRIFTFLGVLELARHQLLDIVQTVHLGAVRLLPRVRSDEVDLRILTAQDEAGEEEA